ncbi:MAG: hypothetical protein ACP5U2_17810, partial [Bryobacteraceae bacterium]
MKALTALLSERGGEIGFGVIQEQSDRGLVRLGPITAKPLPDRSARPTNPFFRKRWEERQQEAKQSQQCWQEEVEP